MRGRGCLGVLILLVLSLPGLAADSPRPSAAGIAFFEQKIRPVLVKHCYSCHSSEAKKSRGGLVVDTRSGLLKGGDAGPAIVPGKPLASLLIKAIRHDGIAMPPKDRLPSAIVSDFEKWVALGAPDPRDGKAASAAGIDLTRGRTFWSFQPPRRHQAPAVRDVTWPAAPLDRFVLAALEAKGLRPVGDADRVVLSRRLSLDLTGLPPTPEEIEALRADRSPDALERLVDRLLASPAFGERWGRHWLDVARYADSNGKDENLTFHEAHLYRDQVVRSFNADKPFAQQIREQIAGDLLPYTTQEEREEQMIATGFLVLGPKVLADRDPLRRKMDVVDEQIDTIGRTFMGLTLGCARCHDHKFDPVPTTDYYALAGILGSTRTLDGFKLGNPIVSGWIVRALDPRSEKLLAARTAHQAKRKKITDELRKARAELKGAEDRSTMRVPGKLVGFVVDDRDAKLVGTWKASTFSRPYVGSGYVHDDKSGKGTKSATFSLKLPKTGTYEVFVSYTAATQRATNVPVTIQHASGTASVLVDQREKPKLDGLFRSVGSYRFEAGTPAVVTISNKDTIGHVIVDAVRFVPTGGLEKDTEMAMGIPQDVKQKVAAARQRVADLEAQEKKIDATRPPSPRLVMAVRDEENPGDVRVAIRGNAHQTGALVPRGFLSVTPGARPKIAPGQSGRLELANWLADEQNPLTARVIVNRVWQHLFGEGLVRSVDNFGVQGEKPSHPELLDTLAVEFVEQGWSIKQLIRRIVTSRTYRLSVGRDEKAARTDPENRLLWRAHRRRLEAEVIRDSILAVSGQLDRSMGGSAVASLGERAIDNSSKGGLNTEKNPRRSVYLPIIRNDLPPIFEVFDFADPDVATGRRDATTVATQALFLLNSPFAIDQARAAATRLLADASSDTDRVKLLYRRALGRSPSAQESRQALAFVGEHPVGKDGKQAGGEAWATLCQALFGCTEFRFVE